VESGQIFLHFIVELLAMNLVWLVVASRNKKGAMWRVGKFFYTLLSSF
jgi:hypothetical protein